MATLISAIEMADDIKPNAFGNETKTAWINEAEGIIQSEVMLIATEDITTYDYERDANTELIARPPYDKLYYMYLLAMIDFANGEYDRYGNSMAMFNSALNDFTAWYSMRYSPADGCAVKRGYYITAYGIAVKHGFYGTEDEWLESLKPVTDGEMDDSSENAVQNKVIKAYIDARIEELAGLVNGGGDGT